MTKVCERPHAPLSAKLSAPRAQQSATQSANLGWLGPLFPSRTPEIGCMEHVQRRLRGGSALTNARLRDGTKFSPEQVGSCLAKLIKRGDVEREGDSPTSYRWKRVATLSP